jgi:hypothetical protein
MIFGKGHRVHRIPGEWSVAPKATQVHPERHQDPYALSKALVATIAGLAIGQIISMLFIL